MKIQELVITVTPEVRPYGYKRIYWHLTTLNPCQEQHYVEIFEEDAKSTLDYIIDKSCQYLKEYFKNQNANKNQ